MKRVKMDTPSGKAAVLSDGPLIQLYACTGAFTKFSRTLVMLSRDRQFDAPASSLPRFRFLQPWLQGACDLLFPPVCCLCGSELPLGGPDIERQSLCMACENELTAQSHPACLGCARPLPDVGGTALGCPRCRHAKLKFDRAFAVGVYGGLLRDAVLRMKQSTGELIALAMGQLLVDRLAAGLEELPDRVVPVPTHWSRRMGRTANCPELLVEVVARRLGVRPGLRLLRCRRRTKKQGTLLPAERLQNVRGAYAVSAGYDIRDACVLVVDDVMTTGATANETANVLRRAGAKRVIVAAVARGIGFDS